MPKKSDHASVYIHILQRLYFVLENNETKKKALLSISKTATNYDMSAEFLWKLANIVYSSSGIKFHELKSYMDNSYEEEANPYKG